MTAPSGQYTFTFDEGEPTVVLTPKGRTTARALAQKPTAAAHNAAAPAAARSASSPVKHVPRSAVQPPPPAPLDPAAHVAVDRIVPLQSVVTLALLEVLAVAAVQRAAEIRALLPEQPYPYRVTVDMKLLSRSVGDLLDSSLLRQAAALNALLASVPDEPIPAPSPEYLAYQVEQARKATEPKPAPATTGTHPIMSTASALPADQFGGPGGELRWPETIVPYNKPLKDGQTAPVCPLVLLVGTRKQVYELPKLALASVLYATQHQVRVRFGDAARTEKSMAQQSAYCVPSPAHLAVLVERYTTFQQALNHLAATLRGIGTYAQRLREACDLDDATTPITSTHLAKFAKTNNGFERLCNQVIQAPDPDRKGVWMDWGDPFKLQAVTTSAIHRHTPQSWQRAPGTSVIAQTDTFVCVDDAQWRTVEAADQVVRLAHAAWMAALEEVGTYRDALERGPHQTTSAVLNPASGTAPAVVQCDMAMLAEIAPDDPDHTQPLV